MSRIRLINGVKAALSCLNNMPNKSGVGPLGESSYTVAAILSTILDDEKEETYLLGAQPVIKADKDGITEGYTIKMQITKDVKEFLDMHATVERNDGTYYSFNGQKYKLLE